MAEKPFPQFQHHGATSGVTGSCHRYIASQNSHYLIDCGLFQGEGEADMGQPKNEGGL